MSNQQLSRYKTALGGLLGVALAFTLALGTARAQDTAPLTGGFTPISVNGPIADGTLAIIAPSAPAAGALIYEDFKQIEAQARGLLARNLAFRESISPYNKQPSFDALVSKFNYESGFERKINVAGQEKSLAQAIEEANQELLKARDLYGYLAVYADVARFRGDLEYNTIIPTGASQPLCGATDKEDANPPALDSGGIPTGEVKAPVIDWCNFTARLRQSVREAANIRLIFAQQFVADALGLHFSADFVGGELAVQNEIAKLRLAQYEYAKAEAELTGALEHSLGNGCYVSDFYQQTEWALLSRAAEGQETTQHHIGVRQSYLGIGQPTGVAQAQAVAQETFRTAAVDGYVKLIGMASLGNTQSLTPGCSQGERPDGLLVAEMAVNMLKTRQAAREVAEGRNLFGFDVMFTPARPYRTPDGSQNPGLWNEAVTAAELAKNLQDDAAIATRDFDNSQSELRKAVEGVSTTINKTINDQIGCSRNDFSQDAEWSACIAQQIAELQKCQASIGLDLNPHVDPNNIQPNPVTAFDQCINQPLIKASEAKLLLINLRMVRLQMRGTTLKAENIQKRINLSENRNDTVTKWLGIKGTAETVARAAQSAMDTISCVDDTQVAKSVACGIAGGVNLAAQTVAGGLSTQADIELATAEQNSEAENLLLDLSELLIDQYSAMQQFNAQQTELEGLLADLADNQVEAQRQRAYLKLSPGNDPSFRIMRDSARLVLAKQLEYAARLSYLAARRAEYEYGARLAASNFRISDIYRARTADDIRRFLNTLAGVTNSLAAGVQNTAINSVDLKISVAQHMLGLTDAALAQEGFTDPAAAQVERTRRFRLWVAQNTLTDTTGKRQLQFSFATSLLDGGLFSHVIQQGYDRYWLHKLAAVNVNLRSDQAGDLSYRQVSLTQGGVMHLRAFSGCVFDYRLLAPAVLLGLEWAKGQPPESTTAAFKANVNQAHPVNEPGFSTPGFLGRPVSATDWQVLVYAGAPDSGLPEMDLQQLSDVELNFSTTYASRQPTPPQASECTRIDY